MIDIQVSGDILTGLDYRAEELWVAAGSLGFPAAMWRLPHQNRVLLLISVTDGVTRRQVDLEVLPAGFIISPFHTNYQNEVLFMEGDLLFTLLPDGKVGKVENKLGEEHPSVKQLFQTADKLLSDKVDSEREALTTRLYPVQQREGDQKEVFQKAVELAVASIRQKEFDKVVLSRTKAFSYERDFSHVRAFAKLADNYPSAFVSLVYLPEQDEIWLGASPETLVATDAQGVFRTASLAGTQKARNLSGELLPKGEVRWGQKEIEEQALVSRYIIECFKKIRLREYLEKGPKTVQAGNLYHLRTDFEVDMQEVGMPELGTTMLRLLHPTSAVCGMPKEPALEFLTLVEGYDRTFYSGYLGPVNVEQESHLFVNLRTMRLANGVATVFAGAGITEDSEPQREWEETELKCQTLLQVLAPEI